MGRKKHLTICLEGLYYLVVLSFIIGGAVLREINLLFVLAGMMIGPLLYNWRMVTVMLKGLDVRRKLPVGVCAGDLVVVEFEATRPKEMINSWAVQVKDRIEREGAAPAQRAQWGEVFFPVVNAGETKTESYRGRLMQRGRYHFGPFHMSTRFPLGLIRRTIRVDQRESLIVCPRVGRLSQRWTQIAQAVAAGGEGSRRHQGLTEGEFYGLRDWQSGDSYRWIHWRTSARRDTLTVRQFEEPRSQSYIVLLDLWQPPNPTEHQAESVELAVSFAATVAEDACRRGSSQLALGVAAAEEIFIEGQASRPLLQEVMHQLAVTEATCEDRLPQLVSRALAKGARNAMVVMISTRHVNLHDTSRFAAAWDDPAKRHALGQMLCINASQEEVKEFFEVG